MERKQVSPRRSDECRLFLICSTPDADRLASFNRKSQEFEFVPVTTQRQYAERAQEFVRLSPSLSVDKSLEMEKKAQEPKTGRPAKASKRPKLALLNTTRDDKPQPFKLPSMPHVLTVRIDRKDSSGGYLISRVEDVQSDKLESKTNVNPKSSSEELLQSLVHDSKAESGELLLPLVYDPNEFSTSPAAGKNGSGNAGIGFAKDVKKPVDKLGFPKTAREEPTADNDILYESQNDMANPSDAMGHDVAVDSVKARQVEYCQFRPEIRSLYADLFVANPHKGDPPSPQQADLANQEAPTTKLILTISSDDSETEDSVQPSTATSLESSSASDQSEDEDMAHITQGFHNALSSIAKERPQPVSSAFGVSAKAMSLLGRTEHSNESKRVAKTAISIEKQSSELEPGLNMIDSLRGVFSRSIFGHSSRKQALEDATTTSKALRDGHFSANSCVSLNRPSKLESVLGTYTTEMRGDSPSPTSDPSKSESRPHSMLYAKLYSQVSKPSGSYSRDSDTSKHGNKSTGTYRTSFRGQFDGEPIKRDSSSSTHTKLVCRMPFAEDEVVYTGKRKTSGSGGARSSTSPTKPTLKSHNYQHHSGSPITSITSNNSFGQSRSAVQQEVHDAPNHRLGVIPSWQPQQLSLAATSENVAANLDRGLSCKRPQSPVKKMFSNTVDMIGRMIPASSNTNSTQGISTTSSNAAPKLKSSVHPADQNRLFGDLEYIIQDTANRFLLYQHAHGHLSSHSIEKTARVWHQKNRPEVEEFLYTISVQQKLVEQNLKTITFHGPLAGNVTAITAIMHTWKYVAKELGVRYFCLPDAGLQHFLREAARLLELLGAAEGHMLHFQAWNNTVRQTVNANYHLPYASHGKPSPQTSDSSFYQSRS